MALDFVSEADQNFLVDNFLSLDDWGADLKDFEPLTEDTLIQQIPDLKLPDLEGVVDDSGSPFTCDSNDAFSSDLSAEPWDSPIHTDDFLDGIIIKQEPHSPSGSSCSDLSSESLPQLLNGFGTSENGFGTSDQYQFDIKLESPPLTPPREEDQLAALFSVPSTTAPAVPSAMPAVVTTIVPVQQNKVTILPKPVNAQPTILPKLEPTAVNTPPPATTTTVPPQTITLKQIPVTVATQPIVQAKNIKVLPTALNGVSYQPPVKQSKIVTPGCNGVSVPITTAPPKNVDVKAWKRQQRMIKNRESACLSRKKKKEYLQGLEGTLHDFSAENEKLRSENEALRKKIIALQKENEKLRSGQSILPQPRKRTACLLAFAFFFAINLAPFSLISQSDYVSSSHQGRALLSFDEEDHQSDHTIPSSPNIDDVIRYTIQSVRNLSRHSDPDSKELMVLKDVPAMLNRTLLPACALFNTTDTVRLVDQLTGWVHGHEAELQEKKKQDFRDKLFKKKKKTMKSRIRTNSPKLPDVNVDETSLQVYDHLFEKSYNNFIEALNRRNDTFYVVSFRKDHLLLPATAHNSTQRPKMSLVMPAIGMNETLLETPDHHFSMMQIDCEVMNTKVVHVKHTDSDPSPALKDILTSDNTENKTVNTTPKAQRLKRKSP